MIKVSTLAECMAEEAVLFWVGCAGSFDGAKKITKAFVLLHNAGVDFAVMGAEESCTGDPAKRRK